MSYPEFPPGSKVEVNIKERGFHGSWYTATVLKTIIKTSPLKTRSSNTNKNNNIKYLVKFDTLLTEATLDDPLTEALHPSFLRPLPPQCGGGFEVGDVVDAYRREGWWIGVVKKVVVEDDDGDVAGRKYVVGFKCPFEEVEFERCWLREHVEWVDCGWKGRKKTIDQEELVNKYATSVTQLSAKKKRSWWKNTEIKSENVGAVNASAPSSRRSQRIMNLEEKDTPRPKRLRSSAGSKGKAKVVSPVKGKSGSRAKRQNSPLMKHESNTTTPEKDKNATHASDDAQLGFTTPSKGALTTDEENLTTDCQLSAKKKSCLRKHTESKSENVGAVDASAYSSRRNKRIMNPVEKDSPRPKRLQSSEGVENVVCFMKHEMSTMEKERERRPQVLTKTPIDLLEGGPEITTDLDRQPLSPPSATSYQRDESLNDGTTEYQQNWPFIKRSPAWDVILSPELHQTPSQKPHFSPLKNIKQDHREGTAIAMMVIFENLVQSISDLQLTDPIDIINKKMETLAELETHGFDVGLYQVRLDGLLSLKSQVGQLESKAKKVKDEIEKCNDERCLADKEIKDIEVKIEELQEKMVQCVRMKKINDEEGAKLQLNLRVLSAQINGWELAFKELAASPL